MTTTDVPARIASQDFRDGAATAAAQFAQRARTVALWGVPLTDDTLEQLAEVLVAEWGGRIQQHELDTA